MNLTVIPKPETYQFSLERNRYEHQAITPYRNLDWQGTVAKHGVTIPFTEIVTRDQGKSVCNKCGAVYAGSNPEPCRLKVHKLILDPSHWNRKAVVTHKLTTDDGRRHKSVVEECEGTCDWDLKLQFDYQTEFFQFVNILANTQNDLFDKFSTTLPAGTKETLQIKALDQRMTVINAEVWRCMNALNQIAQKMNQAGQALHF